MHLSTLKHFHHVESFKLCLLAAATDFSHLPQEVPLKQLVSGSPNVSDQSLSDLKQTDEDGPMHDSTAYAVSITFVIGVTIALILHIYVMGILVCHACQICKCLPQLHYVTS